MTKELGIAIVKRKIRPMTIKIQSPAFTQTLGQKGLPVAISLFDIFKFKKTAKRQVAIIRKGGFLFPTNHESPVYKVAAELLRRVPGKTGVRILIQKNTPPHKGLGSWASASAGTLLALNQLWGLGLLDEKLIEIAQRLDPFIAKILKSHFKGGASKPMDLKWAIVVTPKLIEIDRDWIRKSASEQGISTELVAENHFPDLRMIRDALAQVGWKQCGMSGLGPAIVGFSEKRIGVTKIPKNIRSKLNFVWIGKSCESPIKLLD